MLKVNSFTLYTQQKWTDVFQTIEGLPDSHFLRKRAFLIRWMEFGDKSFQTLYSLE